jgi:hypothetical protein
VRCGEWTETPIIRPTTMQARLAVTSAKAEQELGWKHRPLRETLADEVAWYRPQRVASQPDAHATATAP